MRSPVELPDTAKNKLDELILARDHHLDAARAASSRLQALPRDADERMRSRLASEQDRHNSKHNSLARLLSAVSQWRMELPHGATLEPAEPVSVELKKDETLSEAVARVRAEITSIKQRLQVTRSAPLPLADQKELIAQSVLERARAGRPRVDIASDRAAISFPETMSMTALLCWLQPDAMIEKLTADLREAPNAMSAGDRLARIAELEETLLELERQEESLITQAADAGQEILRRPDSDPRAVLCLNVTSVNHPAVERAA